MAILLCGIPIILEAVIGLVTRFDIKADVLVSLALIASVLIHEDFAAGEVAVIMQLGSLLEDLTVAKACEGIERLVRLTPQTARVIRGGEERIIPAEEVLAGDVVRVLPGETVPVDGVILAGQTSVNQAVMTGESLPADKAEGDEVYSGTVNQFGSFTMEATRVGEDSSIQRMIRLVRSADAGKAKIVRLADRWATWIVVTALSAALLTWLLTGEVIRAVTILVVFCPCALVLATPTAIMAAIGNATRHGFLVSEGDALERLATVSVLAFDKTGTLTTGELQVAGVRTFSACGGDEIYRLAAAAEKLSEHPVGKAIVRCYGKEVPDALQFQMHPGEGVSAVVEGKQVLAGNEKLLIRHRVPVPVPGHFEGCYGDDGGNACEAPDAREAAESCTVIYVAIDGAAVGLLALTDTLRPEAKQTVAELKALKILPVLLTGDREAVATEVAAKLEIEQVYADCLPEEKLQRIADFQNSGRQLCMIGDGINDAPSLKRANVGIALGATGSDIAVDAAGIVIVDDGVKELPHLLALSRRMMTTIRMNLTFSMTLNVIAIVLAMTGVLNPVVGALVHNAGSVLVIANSALLLRWVTSP